MENITTYVLLVHDIVIIVTIFYFLFADPYPIMRSGPTFSKPRFLPASQSPIESEGQSRDTFYFTCTVNYNTIGGRDDDGARFNVSFVAAGGSEVIKSEVITSVDRHATLYDQDLYIPNTDINNPIPSYNWVGKQVNSFGTDLLKTV
eukprot:GHVU01048374.1.p1 GENE.GHVU01048374.1~~GHVU01048374.1.p1  ORF type:complete len:147 (-),score=5.48 GHVU01048374.1:227-667(-)